MEGGSPSEERRRGAGGREWGRLGRRIPDAKTLAAEVKAWQDARNRDGVTIRWCFKVADARKKMHRVYPKLTPAADH